MKPLHLAKSTRPTTHSPRMNEIKPVNPIHRRCMHDQIRDVLMQRIIDGSYQAGERLIELNLAREFNVSQAPVREALRELEAMGLIESQRYCGSRVRQANMDDLIETYALRAILEQRSAELAVPCPTEFLTDLQCTLTAMQHTAAQGDAVNYAHHAVHFHRSIVEQSGNRLFLRTWESMHVDSRVHFTALRVGSDLPDYAQAHVAILAALTDNNGLLAGQLIRLLFTQLGQKMSVPTP